MTVQNIISTCKYCHYQIILLLSLHPSSGWHVDLIAYWLVVFGLRAYALYYEYRLFQRAMLITFVISAMTIIMRRWVLTCNILSLYYHLDSAKYGEVGGTQLNPLPIVPRSYYAAEASKWSALLGVCITSSSGALHGGLVTSVRPVSTQENSTVFMLS